MVVATSSPQVKPCALRPRPVRRGTMARLSVRSVSLSLSPFAVARRRRGSRSGGGVDGGAHNTFVSKLAFDLRSGEITR